MEIEVLAEDFSVFKLSSLDEADLTAVPAFAAATADEVSLVCPTSRGPANPVQRSDGWKALKVRGPLDFSLVGVLSGITAALAEAKVSVFAVSTFDTDYVLVGAGDLGLAVSALEGKGIRIVRPRDRSS